MIKYKEIYKFTKQLGGLGIKVHGNIPLALKKFGNPGITISDRWLQLLEVPRQVI